MSDFSWALQQMKGGKKVRMESWNQKEYIYKFADHILDEDNEIYEAIDDHLLHYNWELFVEPKSKADQIRNLFQELIYANYCNGGVDTTKEYIDRLNEILDS